MKRRLIYVLITLAAVLGMMFIQNKVLVGTQELQARVQPIGDQPVESAKQFVVSFKDMAGNDIKATASERDQLVSRLLGGGNLKEIKTTEISPITSNYTITLTLDEKQSSEALLQRVEARPFKRKNPTRPLWHVTKGIDLQGGVEFACQLYNEDGKRVPADDEVVRVLRGRLDVSGLTEPTVTRLSNGDIQVVIPGGTAADAARTRSVLETTGRLEFREILEDLSKDKVVAKPGGGWTFATGVYHNRNDIVAAKKPEIPEQPPTQFYRLSNPPALTGKDIADANKTIEQGKNAVQIHFTGLGGTRNGAFTRDVYSRGPKHNGSGTGRIAILFDSWVESDPIIETPSEGQCVVSGSFTEDQINSLKTALKAGSLSVTPRVLSERVVGATLGIETVQRALHTMLWTCVAILVFLAYYYRRLGLVAAACMGLLAVLTYSAMSICGATLTMPGIAGLVLSVAMSIDSNILIYERIREELRSGKDIPTSLDLGYDRAFTVIIDSHLTNMAIGGILYWIGSGPVKGFGLTLMLGVAISLFSNVYVGRLLSDLFCRRMKKITMASLVPEIHLPYTGMRKFSYALSIVTGIAGLAWFCFGHHFAGGSFERNFDIEFTGGNMVQVTFKQPLGADEVKKTLEEAYKSDAKKFNLLNKEELSAPQAYFASFAESGDKPSRQWMFRGRDEEGGLIEGERVQTEKEQAKLGRDIEKLRGENATIETVKPIEAKRAQLVEKVKELQTQVTNRTNVFKQQLATAFGDRIAKEGDEILQVKADGRMLHLRLATLEPVANGSLEPAKKGLLRDTIDAVRVEGATDDPSAVDIDVTFKQAPEPEKSDRPFESLFKGRIETGNPELDRSWAQVASAFEQSAVDALAQGHVIVARPFPSTEHFSGQVASQMKWRALLALIVASCAMLAYIAARYELGFGVGAVVSQAHDLLLTLGLVSLFGMRIDMTVVAALLTIIGYSANEVIVNFDRVRENMRKRPLDPLNKIIDDSVAMTIPRTLLTGGSIILALVALLMFGGESIKVFSATLLIGTILGTYSAVFVASPILLMFKRDKLLVPSTPEAEDQKQKTPESVSGYDAAAEAE